MSSWRNLSVKIILLLFCIFILLLASSFVMNPHYTGRDLAETYDFPIGQSVYEGDSILGIGGEDIRVPLLNNLDFMFNQIVSLDISGMLLSLSTGTVPFDLTSVSVEHIDSYGIATGFDGPGFLTYDGDKLTVKAPDNYIWGYNVPSKWLEKTYDGVDLVSNNTVIKHVATEDIKNQNWSSEFFNMNTIKIWYNTDSRVGDIFVLEKGISNFSDGRSDVLANQVEEIFGKNVSDYVAAYPVGTPIVLYMGDVKEDSGKVFGTSLGSHPEYGDTVREYNARQFVEAWNNTIIPPHSYGNGKAYIDFGSASDDNAPGGSASHGVCPPARVLRDMALSEGFSLPIGMVSGENAVLFGFNPSEDIKIANNLDVPVKIIMWTKGSGTGMGIYGKIVRLNPA